MRKQTECGAQCSKFFAVDNHPFLAFNENYDQKPEFSKICRIFRKYTDGITNMMIVIRQM